MPLFNPKPPATPDTNDATTFTDPRDGNVYRTVKIGNQVWMAENLRHNIEGRCCYDNDEANCQKYGRLYTWEAAKKACPAGWHLPTREEWQTLVDCIGGDSVAGGYLKSKSGWYDNGNGTDAFDFSALPGGYRDINDNFGYVGNDSYWWTATEDGSGNAYIRGVYYDEIDMDDGYYDIGSAFSVRGLKD
jgi:uncharacterized protein (TIGR02145 family)